MNVPVQPSGKPGLTPMLTHYREVKAAHPDCLVFYRMGDFYELFFDDAVAAAGALDITLTKRGKQAGQDVPMCGVPVHAAETYLARLIRAGFKVAVCEQMEEPAAAKKRGGSKALVRRDVIRVVTPGTLTEDTLLDARAHSYLAALAEAGGELGLAWLDMTTGDFAAQPVAPGDLGAALARLEPSEILVSDGLIERPALFEAFADWRDRLTVQPASRFDSLNAEARLTAHFSVASLDSFGAFTRSETAAAGALLDYVDLTQRGRAPRLSRPVRHGGGGTMEIDAPTRRNLELTRTLSGDRKGSLLSAVDRTVTGPGARLLAERLAAPLTDVPAIESRLRLVGFFRDGPGVRDGVRDLLKRTPDAERALSRLTLGRGGPRDLAAIRDALAATGPLAEAVDATGLADLEELADLARRLGRHDPLVDRLGRALAQDLPLQSRDGGFIAPGYSEAFDKQTALRTDGRGLIVQMEAGLREETGIPSLKIRHNNVLGYFIEVSTAQSGKMPVGADSPFIHRQTMASATRYTTVALSELESDIVRAADRALAIELALFDDLVAEVLGQTEPIARAAQALAELDVAAALADLAAGGEWCRPCVTADTTFAVTGGRHTVVEAMQPDTPFVPNDCDLGPERNLWLLTGPNMAGKSTFLRQNALIAILAQAGSFVPAREATIGIVDRLFSRVGAADDLARGRSTFMVEMVETAAILNRATPRSLVILDEIGRGTATFDGLSIAWATVEHLHDNLRCRALFATHYHELTALSARLDRLSRHTMRVREWQDEIVFLHEVAPGDAEASYGIHVARLAGMPAAVVARAEEVLATLEAGDQGANVSRLADDLPLFSAGAAEPPRPAPSEAELLLAEINPDELTPRAALEFLYRLKSAARD
ncbi:MAG: DNA mismatch repair protein MutS [Rhodospirillaceae bacterium]|nr:DNA mismatch repair protein MutS [Rhodospirillaceae bacterium]